MISGDKNFIKAEKLIEAGKIDKAILLYEKAANTGSIEALFELGQIYEKGQILSVDSIKAADYYRTAAGKGHARAAFLLAGIYEKQSEYSQAVRYYKAAAERGNADAQYYLGRMLSREGEEKADYSKALDWLSKAAMQGHEQAALLAADICQRVPGFYNYKWAAKYLSIAANNNPEGMYKLGSLLSKGSNGFENEGQLERIEFYNISTKDTAESRKAGLEKAIDFETEGNCEPIAKNLKDGVNCLTAAAMRGNTQAYLELAEIYDKETAFRDYKKAVFFYKKAAELSSCEAFNCLGEIYYNGRKEAIEKNVSEALFWTLKAADKGNAESALRAGLIYSEEKKYADKDKSEKYLKIAADSGNGSVLMSLARLYKTGYGRIEADKQKASVFYRAVINSVGTGTDKKTMVEAAAGLAELCVEDSEMMSENAWMILKQGKAYLKIFSSRALMQLFRFLIYDVKKQKPVKEYLEGLCEKHMLHNQNISQKQNKDTIYKLAVKFEAGNEMLCAVTMYLLAYWAGSRKALYTLINMGVDSSRYFIDIQDYS